MQGHRQGAHLVGGWVIPGYGEIASGTFRIITSRHIEIPRRGVDHRARSSRALVRERGVGLTVEWGASMM